MREFDSIKSKYRLRAAIYAAAGGICLGAAAAGILLIVLKLCAVVWQFYLYLIISVVVAAACGAVIYFILRPSDKKLALKLDREYSLDEKAQTMVQYGGMQGGIIEMQRQDTEAALASLPRRKPAVWAVILRICAVLCAAALLVTGIVLPQEYQPADPVVVFKVDESKIALLSQLIEDVSGDDSMDSDVRTAFTAELESLYTNVTEEGITEDGLTQYVKDSMLNISAAAIAANTYDDVARALSDYAAESQDSTLDYLGEALRNSAKAYTETNITLSSYDQLGSSAVKKLSSCVADYMDSAGEQLITEVESFTDATLSDGLSAYISAFEGILKSEDLATFYDALSQELDEFGKRRGDKVTSGDDLYDRIYDIYYYFYTSYSYINGTAWGSRENKAELVINFITAGNDAGTNSVNHAEEFKQYAGAAMETQAYTYLADAYIRSTLGSIFGVTVTGYEVDDGSSETQSDDPGGESGGGGGTGETEYKSNDKIYDPSTGGYSYYYEMLYSDEDGYLNKLYELLDSDDVSEEIKNFIREYISNLL